MQAIWRRDDAPTWSTLLEGIASIVSGMLVVIFTGTVSGELNIVDAEGPLDPFFDGIGERRRWTHIHSSRPEDSTCWVWNLGFVVNQSSANKQSVQLRSLVDHTEPVPDWFLAWALSKCQNTAL